MSLEVTSQLWLPVHFSRMRKQERCMRPIGLQQYSILSRYPLSNPDRLAVSNYRLQRTIVDAYRHLYKSHQHLLIMELQSLFSKSTLRLRSRVRELLRSRAPRFNILKLYFSTSAGSLGHMSQWQHVSKNFHKPLSQAWKKYPRMAVRTHKIRDASLSKLSA